MSDIPQTRPTPLKHGPEMQGSIPQSGQSPGELPEAVVFHDYFSIRGGGERLALELARDFSAALTYGFRTGESYDPSAFPASSHDLSLPKFLRKRGLRPLALSFAFRRCRREAARFPLRFFSGVAAPFAAPPSASGGCNVFYCHTPPRFVFDQREHFLAGLPYPLRPIAKLALGVFRRAYARAIARMDVIITNSENTRRRIEQFLGRDSIVVYPPIDTERFQYVADGGYFLSTARLTPLKRVDAIVRAFMEMPHKKLVVASGGEELDSMMKMAEDAKNVEFRGWVGEQELNELVGNATATIYLPVDEDFGMSPVESMAAGKPVIGVAEGGLLETVLPDTTGILLPRNFTERDIINAVRSLTPERAASMRSACERRAAAFSGDRFRNKMRAVVAKACAKVADQA